MHGEYDLDHVALAAADTSDALKFLAGDLGGTVLFGGQAAGFRPMQVWVGDGTGDGMSVELIEPWDTEHNDFLARFVARHGAGPHHLTYKVPDLAAAIDRLQGLGIDPVKIDLSDPHWREAFVMPRDAHGTVVQLAETDERPTRAALLAWVAEHGPDGHPRWWQDPPAASGPPAYLRRVVVRTHDLGAARWFFGEVMGGAVAGEGHDRVELRWPGGARVQVEEQPDRAPGVDRLEVEGLAAPFDVAGARFVPAPPAPPAAP